MWTGLNKYADVGLLLLRVGLGISFVIHGLLIFTGGAQALTAVGGVVGHLGITQACAFGILGAGGQVIGGLLLVAGAFFPPACLLLLWIMIMALTMHFSRGDSYNTYSHALELAVVFLGLFFVGPGKLSVDKQ